MGCGIYGRLVLCLSWTVDLWRTGTGSVVDSIWMTITGSIVSCRVYGGLVLGLHWTVENNKDMYWISAGL